ncbi:MAG TPA: DUF1697 domain-containing protein [Propioniciclava tarda]|nr:DUF1697 domain-containing protein [Propioniciclava tarda]
MRSDAGLTCVRVAFFRNLNLGQRRSHSPTSAELVDAFARVGVPDARNCRSNGTVIFTAPGGTEQARAVVRILGEVCGYSDAVLVRSARWVSKVARRLPDRPGINVTLFDGRADPGLPLPWIEPTTGLEILHLDHRHAITAWPADAASGDPCGPVLARIMATPTTTRSAGTITLLADRLTGLAAS